MSGKSGKGAAKAVPRVHGGLTGHERDTVRMMPECRASCGEIARELSGSPSTVSAEVSSRRSISKPKLGFEVADAETTESCTRPLTGLRRRGLSGVRLEAHHEAQDTVVWAIAEHRSASPSANARTQRAVGDLDLVGDGIETRQQAAQGPADLLMQLPDRDGREIRGTLREMPVAGNVPRQSAQGDGAEEAEDDLRGHARQGSAHGEGGRRKSAGP